MFAVESIFLPKTVMLESEWVLRRLYRTDRIATLEALSGLASLPNVHCEDQTALIEAFASACQGMDFADALHLASSHGVLRFATFDEDFAMRTGGSGDTEVYLA